MEKINELNTEISKRGRPQSLKIKYLDNVNQYSKDYYYAKMRELKLCDCCNRNIIKHNFNKHLKSKIHLQNVLEKNIS
jgi:hypothetical protein